MIYIWRIKIKNLKTVSLKIDDSIFGETERILSQIKKSRNRYINDALAFYNKRQRKDLLAEKLKKESELLKAETIATVMDFEDIDYGH